jgi:hypothetical protein
MMESEMFDELANLIVSDEFGMDDDGDSWSISQVIDQLPSRVQVLFGASQLVCIFPEEKEWVAKLPFSGSFECDGFTEFSYNYCELTVEIYQKAIDAGVEQFFAKMKKVGFTKDCTPFYYQERVKETFAQSSKEEHAASDDSKKILKRKRASNESGSWCSLPEVWLCAAIDFYGLEAVEELLNFCEENNLFQDLHSENFGYRFDNSPVLFDYCGFYDNSCW